MKLAFFAAPILCAVATTVLVSRAVPRPASWIASVAWWVAITGLATTVVWAVDRVFRRFSPLVTLFNLSLIFPDEAPPRFRSALRTGTVKQLKRDLAQGTLTSATPQQAAESLVTLAATLNAHDRFTRGHTERVRAYSVMIGTEMGLADHDLERLNWSGLIHDIGKLGVPPEVLNSPDKPTDAEWAVLKRHPAHADALVEPLRTWLGPWAESATQHHERFDGAGYPSGLAGHEITLAGRIVAVADAYDVMTSVRAYKKAMPAAAAREELARNAGTQFDPEVVRAFLNISIGRLRLVMGPLSSIAQFPGGGASLGSSVATGVSAGAAVVTAGFAGLIATAPEIPPPTFVEAAEFHAADFSAVGIEDEPLRIDVAGKMDGSIETLAIVRPPTSGRADLGVPGQLVYTPDPDSHGVDHVSYRACHDDASCDDGTITIRIASVNDAPVAEDDQLRVPEDDIAELDLVANDHDVDGDDLSVALLSTDWPGNPAGSLNASLTAGGRLRVAPGRNLHGPASVTYQVTDAAGATAEARAIVEVVPVNDPPRAVDDAAITPIDTAIRIDVLANDYDVDADPLRLTSVAPATGGSASIAGDEVVFTPDPGFSGVGSVVYSVDDGRGGVDAGRLNVTVLESPAAFTLIPDRVSVAEDTPVLIDVAGNDRPGPSPVDRASLAITRQPEVGTAVVDPGGIRFTPAADWHGTVSLEYRLCDLAGTCQTAAVTITVLGRNDAPTAVDDLAAGTEDTDLVIDVLANDADVDHPVAAGTVELVDGPGFGTAAVNGDGTVTYAPKPDWFGSDSLTYTVTDPAGAVSNPATVTVTVAPVNDAPVATDDGGAAFTTLEDVAFTTGDVLANDTDVETGVVAPTISLVSAPAKGIAISNGDGTFTYTPNANWYGTDTFTYTVRDTDGALSNTAAVSIVVSPVNDPPTGSTPATQQATIGEPFSLSIAASDVEGHSLSYSAAGLPAGLGIDTAGVISGTPAPGTEGTASVSVTITDDGTPNESVVVGFAIEVALYRLSPRAGDIVINEALFTEAAVVDEFVELYNAGAVAVDLTGWTLVDADVKTDGVEDLSYAIPGSDHWGAPSVIQPGEYATVWLAYDGVTLPPLVGGSDGLEYVVNAPLGKLDNVGDSIWLLDSPSHIVDYISYLSGGGDTLPPAALALWDGSAQGSLTTGLSQSISLTPNGADADTSECWEPTTSGTASGPCAGAPDTVDADGRAAMTTSVARHNTIDQVGLVISEYSNDDAYQGEDFIELYNASPAPIDIDGMTVEIADDAAIVQTIALTGPNTVLPPGGHYLLAKDSTTGADQTFPDNLKEEIAIRIVDAGEVVDLVGTRHRPDEGGVPPALWMEGDGLPPLKHEGSFVQSWERKSGDGLGNCVDTDDNAADFVHNFSAAQVNPQSSADPATPCAAPTSPAAATHLVISEFRSDGPLGGDDEFVEIFNPTSSPISLDDLQIRKAGGGDEFAFSPGIVLAPGQHYLVAGPTFAGASDAVYPGLGNSDGVEIFHVPTLTVIDDLVIDNNPDYLPKLEGDMNQSYARKFGGCQDTEPGPAYIYDFEHLGRATPTTSSDPSTPCP